MGHLTVRTMSKLSGVTAHTLRAWEKRYGALQPARTQGGQRTYSMGDLERLRLLKRLTESGYSIGQIAALPDTELKKMLSASDIEIGPRLNSASLPSALTRREPKAEFTPSPLGQYRESISKLVNDLAEFRLDEVFRNLTALRVRLGAREFALGVAGPVLMEIGHLVNAGSMSIAQEHAFSALLRDQLGNLIHTGRVSSSPDTFLVATSEGDLHEFGILISQVLCLSHGIKCHNLGPNLPLESLVFAVKALGVNNVVLGFADLEESTFKTPVSQYIQQLRAQLPKNVTIFVGGGGLRAKTLEEVRSSVVYLPNLAEFDQILKGMSHAA